MSALEYVIGRTVREVVSSEYGSTVTLVLDDGTHYRLAANDEDAYPLAVKVLDARVRVAEIIDRRVGEFEEKRRRAASSITREEERVARERMERLLSPRAYREWLRRHQPGYIMNRALREMWTGDALMHQLYEADPFIGRVAVIPVVDA